MRAAAAATRCRHAAAAASGLPHDRCCIAHILICTCTPCIGPSEGRESSSKSAQPNRRAMRELLPSAGDMAHAALDSAASDDAQPAAAGGEPCEEGGPASCGAAQPEAPASQEDRLQQVRGALAALRAAGAAMGAARIAAARPPARLPPPPSAALPPSLPAHSSSSSSAAAPRRHRRSHAGHPGPRPRLPGGPQPGRLQRRGHGAAQGGGACGGGGHLLCAVCQGQSRQPDAPGALRLPLQLLRRLPGAGPARRGAAPRQRVPGAGAGLAAAVRKGDEGRCALAPAAAVLFEGDAG